MTHDHCSSTTHSAGAAAGEQAFNTVRTAVATALALAAGLAAMTAFGQTPAEGGGQAGVQTLDEVTVTGSRIRRTTDFDTASPTTVVDDTYLKNLGLVNVGDAIAQLPANISNNTPNTTGNANFFAGSTIANLRGLNPFFGSRTLNLVNSRRFVPTNQGDGVDLNFIPSILIDRIDVVTGGASAAYGSGAISGVNNIFLNRKLEGGKADVDFGQTSQSDGKDRHVGLAYGMGLLGDRAHFVLGYEYQKTDAIGCFDARDWCKEGKGFYQNTAGASPSLILGSNLHQNQISQTGVFWTFNPFATTTPQANAAGTGTIPFTLGQQPYAASLPFYVVPGGDGPSIYQFTNLRAPVKRNVGTGTFTFEVTDTTNMSVDLSYGDVKTVNVNQGLTANFDSITPQNAFIQGNAALTAAQQSVALFPGGPAFFDKDWTSQIDAHSEFTTTVKRAAIGFDGKFGSSSWSWDGYYQYGLTKREQIVVDNRHLNAYNYAIDSLLVNGVPTCRVRTPGGTAGFTPAQIVIAQGCVPINPFGNQPISAAAKAYSFGNLDEKLRYEQQLVALNATGNLFAGFGAGAIQGAVGVEYRREKGENIGAAPPGTPDAVRTDYLIQYGESFSGNVDVSEGYLETNIPVLRGKTGAQRLDFDFAVRESQYKNEGLAGTTGEKHTHNLTTWKASAIWDPVEWLRFRGSRSRDARAANFRELYYGQKIGAGGLFGFCDVGNPPAGGPNNVPRDACNWSLEGNSNLNPEKADTTTIGLVFTPKEALPGFQFAADYFRIDITDAIEQAQIQGVMAGCRSGARPADCNLIVFGPPLVDSKGQSLGPLSNIIDIRALAFNGAGYVFKGVDFTSSYLWQMESGNSLDFRLLATHMIDQRFQSSPGNPVINVVGQTGTGNSFLSDNQPTSKWIANLSATWNHGPISVTGQGRYVSDGVMDYLGAVPPATPPPGGRTLSDNHVPSYQVFSLSGSYMFSNLGPLNSFQVFGVVDNVLDKTPPTAVGGGPFGPSNTNGGTNAVFFDTQGRTYRLGVRTTF
jgi:outer membrane receptor protein involved in Fe transport